MTDLKSETVDPKEVVYYRNLANTWWDKKGPFWPLHVLNKLRMQWILAQLPKPLEGMKVLDVGCGGGILSESLAKQGAIVTAIDVVDKNIAIAKTHAEQSHVNIDYKLSTVEDMVQSGQTFDIVFNI